MSSRVGIVWACLLMLCLALAPELRAQDTAGITVSGSARVTAKPTTVEIPCVVSGDAELTADAIVKYRDARKRAVAAIEGLKIPGLSIDSNGYSVRDFVDSAAQQQAMMRGQAVVNNKQKVSVTEQIRIVIKDIDKMEQSALMDTMLKVLDTARDSGLTLGDGSVRNYNQYPPPPSPSLVNFKITDTSAMREQGYKEAIEDAKNKAQKLADLSGVKLGKILSVRDANQTRRSGSGDEGAQPAPSQNELVSGVFDDIPLNVSLTVQFEILK
jgi:uncharacterized protein YggE